jgi:adenylyltransferase/sulfurtransferase
MQLPRVGAAGQGRLARARILVAGCGALGTVVCEQLARAGVGTLTVVDRDVVEWSNLQRQTLFTESDARSGVPKAEAAKARLGQIHAGTVVRAFVDDLHGGNARRYAEEADLLVDCLDNFETRYVLNDCAVDHGIPLIYGGAVALRGMAAALLPITGVGRDGVVRWTADRATPCLRCLAPEPPVPGEVETCETSGVLAAAASVAASVEAALAIRLVAEGAEHVPAALVRFDLGAMEFASSSIAHARDSACPCCAAGERAFLARDGVEAPRWRVLCGRGAVELSLGATLDRRAVEQVATKLSATGAVRRERHGATDAIVAEIPCEPATASSRKSIELAILSSDAGTLAIVSGTTDPERARALVARYIGM